MKAALAWAALFLLPCGPLYGQPEADLTVDARDSGTGESLVEQLCTLSAYGQKVSAESRGSCLFSGVPFGQYHLAIEAPGFKSHEQEIAVFGRTVYVRVDLVVGSYGHAEGPIRSISKVHGTVERAGVSGPLTLRLVPLFGNGGRLQDGRVSEDGRFEFAGVDPGSYCLIVVIDRRGARPVIVASVPVSTSAQKFVLDLGEIALSPENRP